MRKSSPQSPSGLPQRITSGTLSYCGLLALCLLLTSCDAAEEKDVSVVRYEGPAITKADAQTTNSQGTFGWRASVDGETIVLARNGRACGAECGETYRIELRNRDSGQLPAFQSAVLERIEYVYGSDGEPTKETERRTLDEGIVAIQEWNPNGIVSGKVSGNLVEDLVFWYDFSADSTSGS